MKTNILNLTAIALIATASVFTGCKKDDVTAPTVTLVGASTATISLQGTYTEQGAKAEDDKDGALTPTTSGTVDVNMTGTYVITYTATDAAGNSGTATRTITVVNDAASFTATYDCAITPPTPAYAYTQSVAASTTLNNRIIFGKFGDYDNNTGIYADIVGTTITLTSQTAIQVGSPAADRVFAGTGTITGSNFTLTYTETTGGTASSFVETFTKQ